MVKEHKQTEVKHITLKPPTKGLNPEKILKHWDKLNKNAEQMARWMSLYDAVNIVAEKAKERDIDFEDVDLSPIKIKEFMDSTTDIYHRKYLQCEFGIDVFYSESKELFKNSMVDK